MLMPNSRSKKNAHRTRMIAPDTRTGLREALAGWYGRCRRDLPWRRTCDPYRIWVSEVMLQQTQVETVKAYYLRFVAQFGDVSSLARADLQSVLKLWEGLGYYSRARHLHAAAGIIEADLCGQVPSTWEALRCLPGIGDYIAAAVLSIAFGRAYAVVDGNVKRVLARLFLVDTPVNQASGHKVFDTLAAQLLDKRRPGDHNQALMELGALICTPRTPDCSNCPVKRFCEAFQKGEVLSYPKRTPRRPLSTRRMIAGVVVKRGGILMVQRPPHGLLGNLWEFPTSPWAEGLDPFQVCSEQLKSTANLDVTVDRRLDTVYHVYTHFKLHLEIYLCRWRSGRVRLNGYTQFKWLSPEQIGGLPLHGAMHKAMTRLLTGLFTEKCR